MYKVIKIFEDYVAVFPPVETSGEAVKEAVVDYPSVCTVTVTSDDPSWEGVSVVRWPDGKAEVVLPHGASEDFQVPEDAVRIAFWVTRVLPKEGLGGSRVKD